MSFVRKVTFQKVDDSFKPAETKAEAEEKHMSSAVGIQLGSYGEMGQNSIGLRGEHFIYAPGVGKRKKIFLGDDSEPADVWDFKYYLNEEDSLQTETLSRVSLGKSSSPLILIYPDPDSLRLEFKSENAPTANPLDDFKKMVETGLARGLYICEICCENEEGDTFLHSYLRRGYANLMDLIEFIESKREKNKYKTQFDYEVMGRDWDTPLMLAIKTRQNEAALALLKLQEEKNIQVGVNVIDNSGQTLLQLAAASGMKDVIEKLVELLSHTKCEIDESFADFAKMVCLCLPKGANINALRYENKELGSFLHYYLSQKRPTPVKLIKFIESNRFNYKRNTLFNYEALDSYGRTPLLIALGTCQKQAALTLLVVAHANSDIKVGIDIPDRSGRTPLLIAAALGMKDVVEMLLKLYANFYAKDCQGHGLDYYVNLSEEEIADMLPSRYVCWNDKENSPLCFYEEGEEEQTGEAQYKHLVDLSKDKNRQKKLIECLQDKVSKGQQKQELLDYVQQQINAQNTRLEICRKNQAEVREYLKQPQVKKLLEEDFVVKKMLKLQNFFTYCFFIESCVLRAFAWHEHCKYSNELIRFETELKKIIDEQDKNKSAGDPRTMDYYIKAMDQGGLKHGNTQLLSEFFNKYPAVLDFFYNELSSPASILDKAAEQFKQDLSPPKIEEPKQQSVNSREIVEKANEQLKKLLKESPEIFEIKEDRRPPAKYILMKSAWKVANGKATEDLDEKGRAKPLRVITESEYSLFTFGKAMNDANEKRREKPTTTEEGRSALMTTQWLSDKLDEAIKQKTSPHTSENDNEAVTERRPPSPAI